MCLGRRIVPFYGKYPTRKKNDIAGLIWERPKKAEDIKGFSSSQLTNKIKVFPLNDIRQALITLQSKNKIKLENNRWYWNVDKNKNY